MQIQTPPHSTVRQRTPVAEFCLIILAATVIPSVAAADEPHLWTVQKLNDNKPWDRFAGSPKPIGIEGRISASGGNQFRLQHCDLVFTIDKQKMPPVSTKTCVELKGRFEKDGTRVTFAVDDIKTVASYANQFDLKSARLLRPKPEDWYELGDWIAERAEFYSEPDLTKRANDAYSKAIDVEHGLLKRTDAEGRFALAKKVAEYKLPDRKRMDLIHEGYRIQWSALQKADPPDPEAWKQLAETIAKELPQPVEPIKSATAELKETYSHQPESTYRTASDELRPQLHRFFFVDVMKKMILHDESKDGRDGDAIAEQIDQLIPEEHPLAEQYRLKRLDYGVAHLSTATRSEVEKLAAGFRERQQNQTARQVLADWIKAHESRLRGDGVVGLLQLADEYLSLLNDRSSAVQCLMEGSKIDPTFEGVKSKLISLGYQSLNGQWVKSDILRREEDEANSQFSTEIRVGMTASNLRKVLGQPRSLARAYTARGVTEVWSFGPAGSTPLVIRLEQSAGEREPRVSSIPGDDQ